MTILFFNTVFFNMFLKLIRLGILMGKYRMKNKGSAEQSQSAANNDIIFLASLLTVLLSMTLFCQTKASDRL